MSLATLPAGVMSMNTTLVTLCVQTSSALDRARSATATLIAVEAHAVCKRSSTLSRCSHTVPAHPHAAPQGSRLQVATKEIGTWGGVIR